MHAHVLPRHYPKIKAPARKGEEREPCDLHHHDGEHRTDAPAAASTVSINAAVDGSGPAIPSVLRTSGLPFSRDRALQSHP